MAAQFTPTPGRCLERGNEAVRFDAAAGSPQGAGFAGSRSATGRLTIIASAAYRI